ncbi:unnamed protein product [Coccothraustes coccothraustes]
MKKIARRQQQQEQLGNSRGGIPGGRGPGRSGRDGNEDEEGLQRILVPYSQIPPPPLEPDGFGSEAGTFRGTTPPELRPYGNQGIPGMPGNWDGLGMPGPHPGFPPFPNFSHLFPDSEGVFQELDGDALGAALIPMENSQQLILVNAGIPEIPEPRDALERLYPGNPRIPEPGNPMERLYSMQSSYFTS